METFLIINSELQIDQASTGVVSTDNTASMFLLIMAEHCPSTFSKAWSQARWYGEKEKSLCSHWVPRPIWLWNTTQKVCEYVSWVEVSAKSQINNKLWKLSFLEGRKGCFWKMMLGLCSKGCLSWVPLKTHQKAEFIVYSVCTSMAFPWHSHPRGFLVSFGKTRNARSCRRHPLQFTTNPALGEPGFILLLRTVWKGPALSVSSCILSWP